MKLVDLVPLKEIDVNDPALMRARAAKDKMNQMKSNPRISLDQVLDLRGEKRDLELQINNIYREMENDPDVEPEGGPKADEYGDTLNRLETRLYKINKQIASYDMSESTTLNEATEKSWNAVDVSRKAEKEISNKEWNERTAKKLDMLKALNAAGKFKKDFDDERLQGWVDQNYSWEKLSRQFKLNEIYSEMYTEQDKDKYGRTQADRDWEKGSKAGPGNPEYDAAREKAKQDTRFTVGGKPVDLGSIEMGGLEMMRRYGPDDGGPDAYIESAYFLDGTELTDIQRDEFMDKYPDITYEKALDQLYQQEGFKLEEKACESCGQTHEGSCGYTHTTDGNKLRTPGGTKGMDANKRTMTMMREAIRKEIKRLHENK